MGHMACVARREPRRQLWQFRGTIGRERLSMMMYREVPSGSKATRGRSRGHPEDVTRPSRVFSQRSPFSTASHFLSVFHSVITGFVATISICIRNNASKTKSKATCTCACARLSLIVLSKHKYSAGPAILSYIYGPQEEQFDSAPHISQGQDKDFGSNGVEDPRFFQDLYELGLLSPGLEQGGHSAQAATPSAILTSTKGSRVVTPPSHNDFAFDGLTDIDDPPFPSLLVARGSALVQEDPASQICVEPCQYNQHVCLNCGHAPHILNVDLNALDMPSSPEAGSPMDLEANNHRAHNKQPPVRIDANPNPRPKAESVRPAAQIKCEWCEKEFRRQGDRDRHKHTACIYRPHNIPRFKHRCQASNCSFSHLRKDKLLLHVQRAHESKA
ncbi:hypothetical protein AC579_2681 [Pseudocercospora musae]|uniref:Uncharacterized protein n=1 Tax=Pseudocercospora musae TaxID=113226 RepID=A0A139IVB9_9PEZI|nr:hypothetical protein AC579_2681 [Pseudocercospora musae]